MQAHSNILSDVKNGICTIQLNRPEKQNALTQAMYEDLIAAFNEAAETSEVRVVILSGIGEHFTAGNDIADFLQAEGAIEEIGAVRWLYVLHHFKKPVIASVQGNAIGIGTTCLFHCDFVVADNTATFCMPFTSLGLCPEAGVSLLLPAMVGHQKAAQLLMLGEKFNASDALAMHMINHCVTPDERDAVTQAMATRLCQLPADALSITKKLLKTPTEPLEDRMSREFKLFEKQLKSDTARAIFKQFLDYKK